MGLFKKTFTCPYCYGEHSDRDCIFGCTYHMNTDGGCAKGITKNSDGTIPLKNISTCMKCKDASLIRYCPNKTASDGSNYIIPDRVINGNSFPIALIGAKQSGKSNYIAVLVNEIKNKMSRSFNSSLQFCDQLTNENYKRMYYDPLFNNKRAVAATDAGLEFPPLLYAINFFDDRNRIRNSVTLSLYDTAGENFDDADNVNSYSAYLSNAKGIIILLDPLQVDGIREKLEGKIELPEKNNDSDTILNTVINVIEKRLFQGQRDASRKTFPMSIALTFTKMDVLLEYADLLGVPESLRHDSTHLNKGAFIYDDYQSTNIDIQTLLETFVTPDLKTKLYRFAHYGLFGVSSFGENPSSDGTLSNKPHGFRVLDPLLWLLSLEKYIKTVK